MYENMHREYFSHLHAVNAQASAIDGLFLVISTDIFAFFLIFQTFMYIFLILSSFFTSFLINFIMEITPDTL